MLKRILCSLNGAAFLASKENGAAQARPGPALGAVRMQLWTMGELDGGSVLQPGEVGAQLGCPEAPGPQPGPPMRGAASEGTQA